MSDKASKVKGSTTKRADLTTKAADAMKQPRLGFVFNGQGANWHAMGRELIDAYPVFNTSLQMADDVLRDLGANELMQDAEFTRVCDSELAQAVSVALQLCLTDLLQSWNINPSAVTGHSSGEIAAAYAVGALSFQQALGIAYFRGPLEVKYRNYAIAAGGMLAARISSEQAEGYISSTTCGRIVVACLNSPENVTLSGDLPAIEELQSLLEKDGKSARELKVPAAYHSHHMLPLAHEYNVKLSSLIKEPLKCNNNIIFTSPVTGDIVSLDTLKSDHWSLNLTKPMRFSEAFQKMCSSEAEVNIVIEIGPHNILAGPMRQILGDRRLPQITCLRRSTNAVETIQNLVNELAMRGYPVNMQAVNLPTDETMQRFVPGLPDLPSHQYHHKKGHWLEPGIGKENRIKNHSPIECLGLSFTGCALPLSNSQKPLTCVKMGWEPDILHRVPDCIKDTMNIQLNDDEIVFEEKMFRASYHLIYDAVSALDGEDTIIWAPHHRIFFDWMKYVVELGVCGVLSPGSESWSKTSKGRKQILNDELSHSGVAGKLMVRIGENLANIVRSVIMPLDLLTENNLCGQYYTEVPRLKHRTYRHLRRILEYYAVKNPGANVLEMGVGSASVKQIILSAFSPKSHLSGSLLGRYTFAEISANVSKATETKQSVHEGTEECVSLNIESNTFGQASQQDVYDLIVAPMILHTTQNLRRTLSNIRTLLRSGGKLVLVETTQDRLDTQMIFGLLPEWWIAEEPSRKQSPNVSLRIWNNILKDTGFTGIDFDVSDCEQVNLQSTSVMLSTAMPNQSFPSPVSIVTADTSSQDVVVMLARSLQTYTGILPSIVDVRHLAEPYDRAYILTAKVTASLITDPDAKASRGLRKIVTDAQSLLWLSCNSVQSTPAPFAARMQCRLQKMREKYPDKRIVQLDFDRNDSCLTEEDIGHVVHVFQQTFNCDKTKTDLEFEYAVRDSVLHVPRFYKCRHEDRKVDKHDHQLTFLDESDHMFRNDRRFGTTRLEIPQESIAAIDRLSEPASTDATEMLVQALSSQMESIHLVAQAIGARFAEIFNVSVSELDFAAPMSDYGVDSLLAVELRNWLSSAAKARLSISDIVHCSSIVALAALLVERSKANGTR